MWPEATQSEVGAGGKVQGGEVGRDGGDGKESGKGVDKRLEFKMPLFFFMLRGRPNCSQD